MARRGQGEFRENVSRIENACRVTGVQNPRLLIAGHIKPWRSCASAAERLDGHNGLLLTPNIDLLFDRGLISFMDSGERVDQLDLDLLGIVKSPKLPIKPFLPKQKVYLSYHRASVFLA
jgi:putative restriction endonuclease